MRITCGVLWRVDQDQREMNALGRGKVYEGLRGARRFRPDACWEVVMNVRYSISVEARDGNPVSTPITGQDWLG